MESITIKVDEHMAREIEKAMHPLYSTKTEFIREAIREANNYELFFEIFSSKFIFKKNNYCGQVLLLLGDS